ncbi:MAG: polysaccharide biosynthesis/export family protein [Nitrospiria bacterium]
MIRNHYQKRVFFVLILVLIFSGACVKRQNIHSPLNSSEDTPKNAPPDYILGPEDIIDVSVWKNDNLSKTVLIRPDGKISLPLIGDVQAAGLTTAQLRDSIKSRLKEYKETPEVSIIVREINSFVVFVTGEVTHPGKLMLRNDTSLLQAITLAGGFTPYASTNKIVLLRRSGGIETRKIIRYKDIVSGRKPGDDILLQRGDTIVVP